MVETDLFNYNLNFKSENNKLIICSIKNQYFILKNNFHFLIRIAK